MQYCIMFRSSFVIFFSKKIFPVLRENILLLSTLAEKLTPIMTVVYHKNQARMCGS